MLHIPRCAVCEKTPAKALAECRAALDTMLDIYHEKGVPPPDPN